MNDATQQTTVGAHTTEEVKYTDRCMCTVCKEWFNSTYAFDLHRTGEHGISRRCCAAAEMLAKGMEINADRFWVSRKHDAVTLRRTLGATIDPQG
jgi:hypothetical protein